MTHEQAIESMAAERYLLDEMPELERYRFEEHFFECAECAETMRIFQQLRSGAREIFPAEAPAEERTPAATETPAAATPVAARGRLLTYIPWAAAAVLAIALVQQVAFAPRTPGDVLALAPVALRPATRGELPVVAVKSGESLAAVAVDVQAPAGTPLTVRLTGEDGAEVQADSTVAPPPGTALVVLVQTDRVENGGRFVLTISPQDGSGPVEYPFQIVRTPQ